MRLRSFLLLTALSCSALTFARAVGLRNPTILPTATDPAGLVAGDFNHDGKLDVVYVSGNFPQSLHVLLGRGDGTFGVGQTIAFPNSAGNCFSCAINVADINGDGEPDLTIGSATLAAPHFTVFLGNGDGTFQSPIVNSFSPGNSYNPAISNFLAAGDVNGDGLADLVIPDALNDVLYVLIGDGAGHFTYKSKLADGAAPRRAMLADLNGDGVLDVISIGPTGATASVFLGQSGGNFAVPARYSASDGMSDAYLTDFDGDGHLDLLSVSYLSGPYYFKGNADGTFQSPKRLSNTPSQGTMAGLGDFDSDGRVDIALFTKVGIAVQLNSGAQSFGAMQQSISAKGDNAIFAAGDFNGDGHLDIVMGVEGGIAFLWGQGDGTFQNADYYDLQHDINTVALADYDGDKKTDIAVSVGATYPLVLTNDGTGKFTLASDQNSTYGGAAAGALAPGDFNGDGKQDLLWTLPYGGVASPVVLFGNGDGTFEPPVTIPLNDNSFAISDINKDGRSDVVYAGSQIVSLLGQVGDTFKEVDTINRNPFGSQLSAVGDINKDGKPDVVVGENGPFDIYYGNGDGSFSYQFTTPATPYPPISELPDTMAVADLDGDGNLDLIIPPYTNGAGCSPQAIGILYGNADHTFSTPVYLPTSHCYSQVKVVDMNQDKKADLVLNDGYGIAVILNDGGRKFDAETHYVAGAIFSSLRLADLNGDGYPDIVVSQNGTALAVSPSSVVAVLLSDPSINPPSDQLNASFILSPEPSDYAAPFTIGLQLTSKTAGGPVPTGTVDLAIDGSSVSSGLALSLGSLSYTYTGSLDPGVHNITATYSGDSNYGSTTFNVAHEINPAKYVTVTSLTVTPTTAMASETVHMVANVSVPGGPVVNFGVLTFKDGTTTLRAIQVGQSGMDQSAGTVVFDTALLSPGKHSITAEYNGYATPYPIPSIYTQSTSPTSNVTVGTVATTTTLSIPSSTATAGTVVTFNASVAGASGNPFGSVTFMDGTVRLGTMPTDASSSASFSTASLAVGTHSISALFNANGVFGRSKSAATTVTVSAASAALAPTVTAVNWDPTRSAAVASVLGRTGQPDGTVTFLDGGAILGTSKLEVNGTALLAMDAAKGEHSIYASFAGDAASAPSVSPVLEQSAPVDAESFTLAADKVFVQESQPALLHASATNGSTAEIQFTCKGVPRGYTCVLAPSSLPGSGASQLTIEPTRTSSSASPSTGLRLLPQFGLVVCFVAGFARRRKLWILMLLMCMTITLFSCGTAKTHGQTSVVTVSAAQNHGSITIVRSVEFVVQTTKPPAGE